MLVSREGPAMESFKFSRFVLELLFGCHEFKAGLLNPEVGGEEFCRINSPLGSFNLGLCFLPRFCVASQATLQIQLIHHTPPPASTHEH